MSTVKRRNGTRQVTYAGKPLYYYAHDGRGGGALPQREPQRRLLVGRRAERQAAVVNRWENGAMGMRGRVLVVDDEPTITDVVSRYLQRVGYETHSAADGPAALQLAAEARPDLLCST